MTCFRAARRLVAVLAAVALTVAACGDDEPTMRSDDASPTTAGAGAEPGEQLDTVQPGKLTACTDAPHPPFEFEEDGKLDGIDIELVRAVAGRLGLVAEFKDVDFDGIFAALDAGQCDLVASAVSITEERKATVDLSEGYFRINQSLLVRKADEARYKDLESLEGRTIGVQSESTGAGFARKNAKGATVREFTGADEAFTALKAGQVDAVLQDFPVNAHHARSTGETVVVQRFEGEEEEYGFAMRKGRTDLKKAVDDALDQVKSDDTYPTILRRFLGDTAGQL